MDREFRRVVPAADTAVLFIHGKPIKKLTEKPSQKLYEAYASVNDLRSNLYPLDGRVLERNLSYIEQKILSAYHERKEDDSGGDDKNLGG